MREHIFKEQELKLTAILYANKPKVVEYLKKKGTLPKRIDPGGFPTGMRVILSTRGRDPVLTENEQLVFEAILREKRLPGGSVLLIGDNCDDSPDGKTRKT